MVKKINIKGGKSSEIHEIRQTKNINNSHHTNNYKSLKNNYNNVFKNLATTSAEISKIESKYNINKKMFKAKEGVIYTNSEVSQNFINTKNQTMINSSLALAQIIKKEKDLKNLISRIMNKIKEDTVQRNKYSHGYLGKKPEERIKYENNISKAKELLKDSKMILSIYEKKIIEIKKYINLNEKKYSAATKVGLGVAGATALTGAVLAAPHLAPIAAVAAAKTAGIGKSILATKHLTAAASHIASVSPTPDPTSSLQPVTQPVTQPIPIPSSPDPTSTSLPQPWGGLQPISIPIPPSQPWGGPLPISLPTPPTAARA
jgi:hypothetical protein